MPFGSLSYEQILNYVYLNYQAVMFGGKMIKKGVPSTGRMYDFDNMQDTIQPIRNIRKDEWAGVNSDNRQAGRDTGNF